MFCFLDLCLCISKVNVKFRQLSCIYFVFQADVIVSAVTTDSEDIYNKCGALARSVSFAAGRSFSQEYNSDGGLDEGDIRIQDPHNLRCKKVYHVSIRKWTRGTDKVKNISYITIKRVNIL